MPVLGDAGKRLTVQLVRQVMSWNPDIAAL
jgi:hypothetical protein